MDKHKTTKYKNSMDIKNKKEKTKTTKIQTKDRNP